MTYNFGENTSEYSKKKGDYIPVFQQPRYREAREKAISLIESKQYELQESDFWILMNETKNGKMAYNGLILSHNGCLKINDKLPADLKFKPECVEIREAVYAGSLVFVYSCPDQGVFEVGEVNKDNCKNDYPYAMALKRCMDRVILKNSKIAFSGIYSESESDEFREPVRREPTNNQNAAPADPDGILVCNKCGQAIDVKVHDYSARRFGRPLCRDCQKTEQPR